MTAFDSKLYQHPLDISFPLTELTPEDLSDFEGAAPPETVDRSQFLKEPWDTRLNNIYFTYGTAGKQFDIPTEEQLAFRRFGPPTAPERAYAHAVCNRFTVEQNEREIDKTLAYITVNDALPLLPESQLIQRQKITMLDGLQEENIKSALGLQNQFHDQVLRYFMRDRIFVRNTFEIPGKDKQLSIDDFYSTMYRIRFCAPPLFYWRTNTAELEELKKFKGIHRMLNRPCNYPTICRWCWFRKLKERVLPLMHDDTTDVFTRMTFYIELDMQNPHTMFAHFRKLVNRKLKEVNIERFVVCANVNPYLCDFLSEDDERKYVASVVVLTKHRVTDNKFQSVADELKRTYPKRIDGLITRHKTVVQALVMSDARPNMPYNMAENPFIFPSAHMYALKNNSEKVTQPVKTKEKVFFGNYSKGTYVHQLLWRWVFFHKLQAITTLS